MVFQPCFIHTEPDFCAIFLAGNIYVLNQTKAVPSNLAVFLMNTYLDRSYLICPVTYYYRSLQSPQQRSRASILAWIFLDWAASGYSTISIHCVAYFNKIVFVAGGWGVPGVFCGHGPAATMLLSAVISPFLSAWVDRRHIPKVPLFLAPCLVQRHALLLLYYRGITSWDHRFNRYRNRVIRYGVNFHGESPS